MMPSRPIVADLSGAIAADMAGIGDAAP